MSTAPEQGEDVDATLGRAETSSGGNLSEEGPSGRCPAINSETPAQQVTASTRGGDFQQCFERVKG